MPESTHSHTAGQSDPDRDLVQRMAAGETGALRELYARHGPMILAYLWTKLGNRRLAEEVLQDVMLAAWQGASSFRGDSKVRTWLFTIAHNCAAKAQRRRHPAPADLSPGVAVPPASTTAEREVTAELADLRAALDQLPAAQRTTLDLVFAHGLSMADVAAITGVAPGTVKSRLHRAKRALRRFLEERPTDE
jgi:RNA polymerase sigma factor (sigma-70 family)